MEELFSPDVIDNPEEISGMLDEYKRVCESIALMADRGFLTVTSIADSSIPYEWHQVLFELSDRDGIFELPPAIFSSVISRADYIVFVDKSIVLAYKLYKPK